jgi:predicted nucleotidyltransferase
MKTLAEVQSILSDHKTQLFEKYPLKSMAIFGSFSRNEPKASSDVDIIVEFNDKIGIKFIDLTDDIENYIGLKVDLVSRNGIKKRYLDAIKSELIYV